MVKKMNNKLFLITTNDKKFDEWSKKQKKALNDVELEHFNMGYAGIAKGNYLARASFVCYWEIYSHNDLARLAPAITQATFIHMMHRFIERGNQEEINTIQQIMANFLRLLQRLDGEESNEEE
jgi:hypothetical protein